MHIYASIVRHCIKIEYISDGRIRAVFTSSQCYENSKRPFNSQYKFLLESVHDSKINGWKMPVHICSFTVGIFPYYTGFCSYCFEWLPRLQEHYSVFLLFIKNRSPFLLTLNVNLFFSYLTQKCLNQHFSLQAISFLQISDCFFSMYLI